MRSPLFLLVLLLPPSARAQCYGTTLFPPNTIVPDTAGATTTISTFSYAGDHARVSLVAGNTYRFTSSTATDHITLSTAVYTGALAFGTQPLVFTATTTKDHFIHVHTNAACGTQSVDRTTQVARLYCTAGTVSCGSGNESITSVSFGDISNTSGGCGGLGYSDFSTLATPVFAGQSLPISVVNSTPFAGDQVKVFVDWDRDFDLEEAGEVFTLGTVDNGLFTGTITAPLGNTPGAVRMRVRLGFTGALSACGTSDFGEVEDYALNVMLFGDGIFAGGNGRGEVVAGIVPATIPTAVFGGGDGRGEVMAAFQPAPIPAGSYNGGNGRGEVMAAFVPAPAPFILFSGGNGRGEIAVNIDPRQIMLALKGCLEGPYSNITGLMGDALRTLPTFPLTEPYAALGYTHVFGGSETTSPAALATTDNNAIVDWVLVELRNATTPTTVVATRSALVQRDGDVVAGDGLSPIAFNKPPGSYFVALRHRNHLGVMTLNSVALSATAAAVDLTVAATATFGTAARKSITGSFPTQALWAGDVTFNGEVKYTGSGNDRDPILTTVGSTTPNNSLTDVYSTRDVNMNGEVKYTGSGNDRDPILVNLGSTTPNNVRVEQLP